MPFLLLLLLTLVHLQQKWPDLGWTSWGSTLVTWCGLAGLLVRAEWLVRSVRRQMARDPGQRPSLMKRFHRLRRRHGWTLLALFTVALYFLGWGWTVTQFFPAMLPGIELILLLPFLMALIFSWARFYDVERQSHQLTADPDDPPFMSRWAYLAFHVRHNLLLIIPPLALLLLQQTLVRLWPELQQDSLLTPLFAFGLLLLAFLCIPLLLRVFLGLKPLPDCPLRDRLLATARRLRFRFNDILIWNTRNTIANAMVTGFVPFLRYVVLTDRLIDELTDEEIEAVFGHEVGHVKHHHMLFYLGFLLASLVVVGGVWRLVEAELNQPAVQNFFLDNVPVLYDWLYTHQVLVIWGLVLLLALYIFVVFGFISRRCERQADIFGCRTVTCPVFIAALEKVAALNGIPRERPGWLSSWQHSTIAQRVDFLERLHVEPGLESRFQRRVGLVKWGVVLGLTAFLAGILALLGSEVWDGMMKMP